MSTPNTYPVVVIGCSAGGLAALSYLLEKLPVNYCAPVIVVQHRTRESGSLLESNLQEKCAIKIKQADEKEFIVPGWVYIAPPAYHLLVEQDETFSLSMENEVRYSRPSIDVLFETAAEIYGKRLTGIVLTGASNDGASGIMAIRDWGGTTIAQDPSEATYPVMPKAAIETGQVQHVMTLEKITAFLNQITYGNRTA